MATVRMNVERGSGEKATWFFLVSVVVSSGCGPVDPVRFVYCQDGVCTEASAARADSRKFHCERPYDYALTFDDGPSPNTEAVLEILDKHDIPATFFVLGNHLESQEQKRLARRIYDAGHQLANHAYDHRNLTTLEDEEILVQLARTRELLLGLVDGRIERESMYMRPPFGAVDERVSELLVRDGYTIVIWNGDRYDWNLGDTDGPVVVARVLQQFEFLDSVAAGPHLNRSILDLNHDRFLATVEALNTLIQAAKDKGYDFVTVKQCLDPTSLGFWGKLTRQILRAPN